MIYLYSASVRTKHLIILSETQECNKQQKIVFVISSLEDRNGRWCKLTGS